MTEKNGTKVDIESAQKREIVGKIVQIRTLVSSHPNVGTENETFLTNDFFARKPDSYDSWVVGAKLEGFNEQGTKMVITAFPNFLLFDETSESPQPPPSLRDAPNFVIEIFPPENGNFNFLEEYFIDRDGSMMKTAAIPLTAEDDRPIIEANPGDSLTGNKVVLDVISPGDYEALGFALNRVAEMLSKSITDSVGQNLNS